MADVERRSAPRITVLMTVYNAEPYVLPALRSIAAQTHREFDVLVWDDGSTDRSRALIAEFCAGDDRFALVGSDLNQGLVRARRQAIARARGQWIAMCDADDIWLPRRLERQLQVLERFRSATTATVPGVAVLGSAGHHINIEGRVCGHFDAGLHTVEEYLSQRAESAVFHVLNSSALFLKDVYDAVGGHREDYCPADDVDLWTRMAEHGLVLNLPEVLVQYRVHGASVTDRRLVSQMLSTRRSGVNAARRRQGLPELTHDEHLRQLRTDPVGCRRLMAEWVAQAHYRRSGVLLANGQYVRGAWSMARSFAIDPRVPLRRLRRQVLRPDVVLSVLGRR